VNASYQPTATMRRPADCGQPAPGAHHAPAAGPLSRRANRLLSPNVDPNNGRHARWCSCIPGYVCDDHRLRF
jgi:hypothetical protein